MDESGNHHCQQTDTRTENQKPHVLTHKWVLNNENTWTQGVEYHPLGPVRGWEARGEIGEGWEAKGGIALEEIPNIDDGEMDAAHHYGTCVPM